MPWKIEERNGKHCVVRKPDGKVEKCHTDPDKAKAHMRALYASEEKSLNGFTVKQDKDGVWHWMGIVSNNWLDKQFEWISAKAHQSFVEKVDSGEYGDLVLNSWLAELPGKIGDMFKEIGERGTPDLWYWHIPVPIGYSELVAYDERGYLVASGRQKEGEFYSTVFKEIAESPIRHGMSHGMPNTFVEREKENERIIGDYLSTEFTALPDNEAANWGTAFSTAMKEAVMQIPENKKERMTQIFSEDTVAQFDTLLDELEVFADDSEIPRKEKTAMTDKTPADAQVEEEEIEEVEETEEVESTETDAEEAVDESDASESDKAPEVSEVAEETGMELDPSEFQVPTDFKAFAEEIKTGLKEIVVELQANQDARFAELQKQLDEQKAEFAKLKEGEDERIAAKAAETPIASMSGWLATQVGSVIGKDGARIDYNSERELYNKSKQDEVASPVPGVPATIGAMIQRQQGRGNPVRVRTSVDGQN
jgi:hypothetical protein